MRSIKVSDTWEIKDRGTMYVVEATVEDRFVYGEVVELDGFFHRVIGCEYFATNTPKYVTNGQQAILLGEPFTMGDLL